MTRRALGKGISEIPVSDGQISMFTVNKPTAKEPIIYVQRGCYWIRDNRQHLKTIMSIVHREVDKGNPCVQRGDIYVLARQAGMSISDIRVLKRDNNLWSVLARYMVMLQPRLARALNFKDAGIDTIDLIGEWRSIVNAGTTFLALSWREAKDLCAAKDACSL